MALEGNLQDMSLVDLFQVFRMGPKTGILVLDTITRQAIVYVNHGEPIDATIVLRSDQGVLTRGEAAVFEILQWSDATFCFNHDPCVRERTPRIFRDSESLVEEGTRRLQETCLTPITNITPESRFRMAPPSYNTRRDVSLNLVQWRVLSQMAIANNIRQISANTGLALDVVIQVASDLARLGLIELVYELAQPAPHHRASIENPFHTAPAVAAANPVVRATPNVQPGKTLLNAIMRRVRGL